VARDATRVTRHSTLVTQRAFTLIELLVVISIMGILAALAIPAIKAFGRAEATHSATRQMLDDLGRARQLALSQRTTVYMIFCPSNFWLDPAYAALPQTEKDKAAKLYDKQLNSYTFVSLRSVGDQPGRPTPRYLAPWRSLPDGNFIANWKFAPRGPVLMTYTNAAGDLMPVRGFSVTNSIPFPSTRRHPAALSRVRPSRPAGVRGGHFRELRERVPPAGPRQSLAFVQPQQGALAQPALRRGAAAGQQRQQLQRRPH
jgi:prepilin-type N-terminal cleavage/methylation domain-containing protein